MNDTFKVDLNTATVIARLEEIAGRVSDMRPALGAIGEILTESTKERFTTSTAPDGKRWAPNAPATVLSHLADIKGAYSKRNGKLTKRGATAAMGKKPLVDTGMLQDSIRYQLTDNSVEIGTDRFAGEWEGGAAVFHWGSKDGKIPARPILGVSPQDEVQVLDVLDDFLRQALPKG